MAAKRFPAPIDRLAAIFRLDMPPARSRSTSRILRMGNLCPGMPRSLLKEVEALPIRRSPNGVRHTRPQPGRNRPEWVVAINRNEWSQSIVIAGRNQPVRPASDRIEQQLRLGLPIRQSTARHQAQSRFHKRLRISQEVAVDLYPDPSWDEMSKSTLATVARANGVFNPATFTVSPSTCRDLLWASIFCSRFRGMFNGNGGCRIPRVSVPIRTNRCFSLPGGHKLWFGKCRPQNCISDTSCAAFKRRAPRPIHNKRPFTSKWPRRGRG